MGSRFRKAAPIGLPVQLMQLKQKYGDLIIESGIKGGMLSCIMLLTPSLTSTTYKVLITYKMSDSTPRAWLIEPIVESSKEKKLEHVYEFDAKGHPRLCVYDPKTNEWAGHMLLATSYVPWIVTWLNTYEYWLITDKWTYPAVSHGKKE